MNAKAQPAPGFPSGWTFYYDDDPQSSGSHNHKPVSGLYILSPGNRKFRSVQAAVAYSSFLQENVQAIEQEFYSHVGLLDLLPNEEQPTRPEIGPTLGKGACGDCRNCMKAPCGKCFMCREDATGDGTSCFQKVWPVRVLHI